MNPYNPDEVVLCRSCPLGKGKGVAYECEDYTKLKLFICSDYPGEYEEQDNRPFAPRPSEQKIKAIKGRVSVPKWDNAGAWVRNTLLPKLGLVEEEVFFTNAIKCNPRDKKPKINEKSACYTKWLSKELLWIDQVKPNLPLLFMGTVATEVVPKIIPFVGGTRVNRGKVFFWGQHPLMVTVNPAVICRNIPRLESNVGMKTSHGDNYIYRATSLEVLPHTLATPEGIILNELLRIKDYL